MGGGEGNLRVPFPEFARNEATLSFVPASPSFATRIRHEVTDPCLVVSSWQQLGPRHTMLCSCLYVSFASFRFSCVLLEFRPFVYCTCLLFSLWVFLAFLVLCSCWPTILVPSSLIYHASCVEIPGGRREKLLKALLDHTTWRLWLYAVRI